MTCLANPVALLKFVNIILLETCHLLLRVVSMLERFGLDFDRSVIEELRCCMEASLEAKDIKITSLKSMLVSVFIIPNNGLIPRVRGVHNCITDTNIDRGSEILRVPTLIAPYF